MEKDKHLYVEVPLIITQEEFAQKYGVSQMTFFKGWFDITYSKAHNKIVSNFEINPNVYGDSLLKSYNIPALFPAVIRNKSGSPFVHFCGNFANLNISVSGAKWPISENINKVLSRNLLDERVFFENITSQ